MVGEGLPKRKCLQDEGVGLFPDAYRHATLTRQASLSLSHDVGFYALISASMCVAALLESALLPCPRPTDLCMNPLDEGTNGPPDAQSPSACGSGTALHRA